jgi:hypothetical protein
MNNTTYIIIDIAQDTHNVDFSQINQNSSQTMRRNLANTQAVLSYQVEPTFITTNIVVPLQTLNQTEVLALMATPEWSDPNPPE